MLVSGGADILTVADSIKFGGESDGPLVPGTGRRGVGMVTLKFERSLDSSGMEGRLLECGRIVIVVLRPVLNGKFGGMEKDISMKARTRYVFASEAFAHFLSLVAPLSLWVPNRPNGEGVYSRHHVSIGYARIS